MVNGDDNGKKGTSCLLVKKVALRKKYQKTIEISI